MHLKLLLLLTLYALLVKTDDVDREENVESYITKEAAKELSYKLNARGVQQDGDYDEILKQIIMSVQQPAFNNLKQFVYEKKYFDYLPNDLDSEDVTDEDSTHELIESFNDAVSPDYEYLGDNMRRANSRRLKRDISSQQHQQRDRRQSVYLVPVPLIHRSQHPNIDFYFPRDLVSEHSNGNSYQSRFGTNQYPTFISPNPNFSPNPWTPQNNPHQQFRPPYNFYLPAQPDNNNPSPPDNPDDPIGNRISMFEVDDRPVWSSFPASKQGPYNNKGSNAGFGNTVQEPTGSFNKKTTPRPLYPQTTQRPTTSKPNNFVDQNALDFGDTGDQNIGVEIELPVPDYDEPLTTRAPLRKASRKPTKRVTSTTTRPLTPSPSNQAAFKGRKPNQKVSPCVLAIVNCCSRYDSQVRTSCFEQYRCSGAFFGRNPCSSPEIKAAAFREVEKFSK